MRVLTANVYNGRAKLGSLRRVLQREQPDLAAFQELDPAQARIVEQQLPHGRLDPRRDYHGMGIAATRPIEVDRFPMTHRDGWRAVLRERHWPQLERDIEVLNVHIQNPLMWPLRQTARNRRGQVDDVLEYTAAKRMARVIVGDMNASPAWGVYKRLAARFQDAAAAAGTTKPTWSYFWWLPPLLRIDHVFVEGLVPLSTHTARIGHCDHYAVIADLYVE